MGSAVEGRAWHTRTYPCSMLRFDSARVVAIDTLPLLSLAMQVPQRPSVQDLGASIPAFNAASKSVMPALIGTV